MARIAFVTESLPPGNDAIANFSYEIIHSLADQQHDIRVLTTYREGQELPEAHPRIEILRPFQTWSWLEIPRMLPTLLEFQPDVLHLIQPREESLRGFTNAMAALPTLVGALNSVIGRTSIVSSFYDLREADLKTHARLIFASDAITVSNASQKEKLNSFFLTREANKKPLPFIEVWPVPVVVSSNRNEDAGVERSPLHEFLATAPGSIFLPGEIDEHDDLPSLFRNIAQTLKSRPESALVIGGGWGRVHAKMRHSLWRPLEEAGVESRVFISGALSEADELRCLEASELTVIASLPVSSLSVTRLLRGALRTSAPLLMSGEQAKLDPLNWRHRKTAFIQEDPRSDWSQKLIEALADDETRRLIRSRLPDFAREEAIDLPGNLASRFYSNLLELRKKQQASRKTR